MRTAAKHLIDHEKGRKIAIRAHHQEKKKVYDFESKILLEEEWGRWSTISKRKVIYVDERNGKRGIHLDFTWVGYIYPLPNSANEGLSPPQRGGFERHLDLPLWQRGVPVHKKRSVPSLKLKNRARKSRSAPSF